MTPDNSNRYFEDIWHIGTQTSEHAPNGGVGVWMKPEQFETLMHEHHAIWGEVSSAFQSSHAKPNVFVGRRGDSIDFLLFHHKLSAELGIWLAPSQRGKKIATAWLRAGLANIDWSSSSLLMATCPSIDSAAARAFVRAGFRILANQDTQVVLCFYGGAKKAVLLG